MEAVLLCPTTQMVWRVGVFRVNSADRHEFVGIVFYRLGGVTVVPSIMDDLHQHRFSRHRWRSSIPATSPAWRLRSVEWLSQVPTGIVGHFSNMNVWVNNSQFVFLSVSKSPDNLGSNVLNKSCLILYSARFIEIQRQLVKEKLDPKILLYKTLEGYDKLIHAFRAHAVTNNFDEYILLHPQQQAMWIIVLGCD